MFVLKTKYGNRRFEIYDQNYHFLMGLLSNDMTSEDTISLSGDYDSLATYECNRISSNITQALSNNIIYEVWDGIKIEPLFNPTPKILNNLKEVAQPLTEKRKNFLLKLVNFLETSKNIQIEKE